MSEEPGISSVPSVEGQTPPGATASVDRARQGWIRRLIDLSRRNNLLYFRDLQTGTLDLSAAPADSLARLLEWHPPGEDLGAVPIRDLVPADDEKTAAAKLREIRRRAVANYEERGLETLFLALGLATWPAQDGGRPASAPVLLMPVELASRGREGRNWHVRRTGEVQVNPVLLHALDAEHGVTIAPEEIVAEIQGDDEDETFDLGPAFDRLTALAAKIAGFGVERRWVIGNFSFQKMAIVKDLRERLAEMSASAIIAGLAGDAASRESARGDRSVPDPSAFDAVPPEQEFLVLTADSTQQKAISATLSGRNGVVSGPPGTGKSQTIANLIAELAARGKSVLFVAEKRAALDVVLRRLEDVGLKHLCLDLHGADLSRRRIRDQLAESLELHRTSENPDVDDLHRRFADRRARLNGYVRALHQSRPPAGLSAYQIQGRLLRLPDGVRTPVRWPEKALEGFTKARVDLVRDTLQEAAGFAPFFRRTHPSPWAAAWLPDEQTVRTSIERADRLARERWPALSVAIDQVVRACGLRPPANAPEIRETLALTAAVNAALDEYRPEIFGLDLDGLIRDLEPSGSAARRLTALVFSPAYRAARRQVKAVRIGAPVAAADELEALRRLPGILARWRQRSQGGGLPVACGAAPAARECLRQVEADLLPLAGTFPEFALDAVEATALGEWLARLADDRATPLQRLRCCQLVTALEENDAAGLLPYLADPASDPARWPSLFDFAWLSSLLEAIQLKEPGLAGFNGRTHDTFVSEFSQLDESRIEAAVARVRRACAEHAVATRNSHPDQDAVVCREAQKKSRHLPLRTLFAQAADVLLALEPCWMASPLSVSQLLPADRPYFDVVLFDEASQVLPEDAVASLLRGRQAVVAGDKRQLPPTTFFAAGTDEEESGEEAGPAEGFESVLEQMSSFLDPPWSLDWHYRSRDESLIAFSNHHIYGDRLVTFPNPSAGSAVSHVLVSGSGREGEEESCGAEVSRVVSLILQHAEERPAESLGVITMGIKHAMRLEAALDEARESRPDLDEFFNPEAPEKFFVKNLERVQGDERDAIVLSIGYGKDPAGRLPYRFGPLLGDGGERRLNVAITRARRRLTLVSSFSHLDMAPSRSKARGVELLRAYREYASTGGRRLGGDGAREVPLNEFEQAVFDALTARGIRLLPQYGTSGYRIDMVAVHPGRAGRMVLAIECDGRAYHSAPTARDRDRLRQQHLEALGWEFHRIWSTDWFLRREEEVERAVAAYRRAVEKADRTGEQPDGALPATERPGAARPEPPAGAAARERSPRPAIARRESILEYSDAELTTLVGWILDGELLTDDELVDRAVRELGFSRRGSRIDAAIRRAIPGARRALATLGAGARK